MRAFAVLLATMAALGVAIPSPQGNPSSPRICCEPQPFQPSECQLCVRGLDGKCCYDCPSGSYPLCDRGCPNCVNGHLGGKF
ncbi:hypothetical protein N656DRAFT_777571 [Canariomyces notabilis]|uniref:Uncharacterized protein n=1 Tax=Canariomyces notabilis TaxID=2074819 RepID=A0AAN6TH48_9PEZI|nr:hypothetical protein N656DRAFT_777571 [Canariomyces arenarius]